MVRSRSLARLTKEQYDFMVKTCPEVWDIVKVKIEEQEKKMRFNTEGRKISKEEYNACFQDKRNKSRDYDWYEPEKPKTLVYEEIGGNTSLILPKGRFRLKVNE